MNNKCKQPVSIHVDTLKTRKSQGKCLAETWHKSQKEVLELIEKQFPSQTLTSKLLCEHHKATHEQHFKKKSNYTRQSKLPLE